MQMGIESGEVVEIDGDCYGDAVNSAARLADLAGADQILTTQRVRDALPPTQQAQLRSLGPMYLRGKSEVTEVYRVDWQLDRDADATVMGVSMFKAAKRRPPGDHRRGPDAAPGAARREADPGPRHHRDAVRSTTRRVSRIHATVEWRGGHFVLSDVSSFGTWVYIGNQTEPVVLRRTECYLVGHGQIALGCDRSAEDAPWSLFSGQGLSAAHGAGTSHRRARAWTSCAGCTSASRR